MSDFNVRLSDIARRIRERGDNVSIDTSTLRVMCDRGALKNYAIKDGNSWVLPLDVAQDLITNWKPYTRWEPSQRTVANHAS